MGREQAVGAATFNEDGGSFGHLELGNNWKAEGVPRNRTQSAVLTQSSAHLAHATQKLPGHRFRLPAVACEATRRGWKEKRGNSAVVWE